MRRWPDQPADGWRRRRATPPKSRHAILFGARALVRQALLQKVRYMGARCDFVRTLHFWVPFPSYRDGRTREKGPHWKALKVAKPRVKTVSRYHSQNAKEGRSCQTLHRRDHLLWHFLTKSPAKPHYIAADAEQNKVAAEAPAWTAWLTWVLTDRYPKEASWFRLSHQNRRAYEVQWPQREDLAPREKP